MNNLINSITLVSLARALAIFIGFVTAMFLGTIFLPGKQYTGCLQPDVTQKSYKLNGLLLFVVTTLSVVASTLIFDFSLAPLCNYFWSMFAKANIFAFAWASILYARGPENKIDDPKSIGEVISDLWFGVELNPTWLGVDLKMFAYQPSLIGFMDVECLVRSKSFGNYQYQRKFGTYVPEMLAMTLHEVFCRNDESAVAIRRAIYQMWRQEPQECVRTMNLLSGAQTNVLHFSESFLKRIGDRGNTCIQRQFIGGQMALYYTISSSFKSVATITSCYCFISLL